MSFSALAFACASLLAPAGPLGRRRLVLGLGLVAFVLAIQLPGMLELYRFVPVVGLGATVRLAPVAALMLGLLAGDALQSAPRAARTAAACVLVPLLVGVFVERGSAPLPDSVPTTPEESELVGFALTPPSRLDGEHSAFEGWLAREVALGRGRLVLEAIDAHGQALSGTAMRIPLGFFPDPSERARSEAALVVASAPEGARWFRTPFVLTGILPDGHWSFRVEFMPEGSEEAVVVRRVGVATIRRANRRDVGTILFVLAGLACLLLPSFSTRTRWVVVLLVGAQGLYFARGVNPFVPRAEVFPPTRTEELLGRELGPHRFLCDPAVLPADTGLVRGLRAIQGYDAMDVAAFNFFREYALHPGTNPLLAWNARGVDLDSPAFLLYGVKMLVLREPLEHPGWELVASPEEADAARRAETWLYRARDPLPRAFCVAQVVSLDELGELHRQDPHGWSPLELAALEEDWRPARPFTSAAVSEPVITNREVRLTAELDGDGLLVVTEQAFPGWKVYVDGEERSVLTADMIFRGVALGAGTHDVVFRYEPLSIRVGTWLSLVAAASIVVLALAGVRAGTGTGTGSGAPRRGETPG